MLPRRDQQEGVRDSLLRLSGPYTTTVQISISSIIIKHSLCIKPLSHSCVGVSLIVGACQCFEQPSNIERSSRVSCLKNATHASRWTSCLVQTKINVQRLTACYK